MENQGSEEYKRDLEQSLLSIIYQFVEICKKYAENTGKDESVYWTGLDLRVLRICIFMSLPMELINTIENIEQLIEELLWTQFIEKDNKNNDKNRTVKIAGYLATTQQASCFFLYSLLLYSHILDKYSREDKEDFYRTMILYPCYRKIMELNSKKKRRMIRYLKINPQKLGKLIDDKEIVVSFRKWVKYFKYQEYVNVCEISEKIQEASEGAMNPKEL